MSTVVIYEKVRRALQNAENVFIYAGAGMSTDLGIKNYWNSDSTLYDAEVSKYGFTTLEHANASMWKENYDVQKSYSLEKLEENFTKLSSSTDNIYTRLLDFLEENGKSYTVVTSNTDNAFIHYGYSESSLYEVHGNQRWLQCTENRHGVFPLNENFVCPECKAPARLNVFMLDDYNFQINREAIQIYNYFDQSHEMSDRIESGSPGLILEIGVGNTTSKIRNMARKKHKELDIPYIHVNPAKPVEIYRETDNERWVAMAANCFSENFLNV